MRLPARRSLRYLLLAAVAGVSLAFTAGAHASAASRQGPGRLAIARVQYEGGGDWYANPSSLPNLIRAISERTEVTIELI
jgi:hypothetical protein